MIWRISASQTSRERRREERGLAMFYGWAKEGVARNPHRCHAPEKDGSQLGHWTDRTWIKRTFTPHHPTTPGPPWKWPPGGAVFGGAHSTWPDGISLLKQSSRLPTPCTPPLRETLVKWNLCRDWDIFAGNSVDPSRIPPPPLIFYLVSRNDSSPDSCQLRARHSNQQICNISLFEFNS